MRRHSYAISPCGEVRSLNNEGGSWGDIYSQMSPEANETLVSFLFRAGREIERSVTLPDGRGTYYRHPGCRWFTETKDEGRIYFSSHEEMDLLVARVNGGLGLSAVNNPVPVEVVYLD